MFEMLVILFVLMENFESLFWVWNFIMQVLLVKLFFLMKQMLQSFILGHCYDLEVV